MMDSPQYKKDEHKGVKMRRAKLLQGLNELKVRSFVTALNQTTEGKTLEIKGGGPTFVCATFDTCTNVQLSYNCQTVTCQ